MGDTKISWTDKTWPITVGCQRVSAGCGDGTGGGCYRKGRGFGGPVIELPYLDGEQHAAFPEVDRG